MQSISFYIKHRNILATAILLRLNAVIPEKLYLKWLFRLNVGYKLNLDNPVTFNEKLQWLKLYDRKPEYTSLVDKCEVKKIVGNIIGQEYIIPTLGVWNRAEEIDWDSLPNQFVLKTTHGSGGSGVVICKDKSTFDKQQAIRKLNRSLRHSDTYAHYREWPYKNVKRRIIAEQYLSDDGDDLADYKIHSFNGVPKVILVCRDRFKDSGLTEDFYSAQWEHLDVKRPAHDNPHGVEKPKELQQMLQLTEQLSAKIPFVRTDFYAVKDKLYFGELTFYPASGLVPFEPEHYDKMFGDWLVTPSGGGNILLVNGNMHVLLIRKDSVVLNDYKFFCFDGEVKFFKVDFGRFVEHHANYYDPDGQLLPFGEELCLPDPDRQIKLPANLNKMIKLASAVSCGHAFLRVDLYDAGGKIYFGEATFYPASGMGRFQPENADALIGKYLSIPA